MIRSYLRHQHYSLVLNWRVGYCTTTLTRYRWEVVDAGRVPHRAAVLPYLHAMPKNADDRPMYVRLPAELHEAVKERAGEEDRTMAQTIRVALRYYLQQTSPMASA